MKELKERIDQISIHLDNLLRNVIPMINQGLLLDFNQEDKN